MIVGSVRLKPDRVDGDYRTRSGQCQGVVHDCAAYDREHRMQAFDRGIRHLPRIEEIVTEHHGVRQLADFDRSEVVLLVREPTLVRGLHAKGCSWHTDGAGRAGEAGRVVNKAPPSPPPPPPPKTKR